MDMWRFLASPNRAAEEASRKRTKTRGRHHEREEEVDTRLPWYISAVFFVFLARVVLGDALLIGVARMVPMPAWFTWLVIAHGVAVLVALLFVLNGWGWARLVLLALSLLQLLFDQAVITIWYLLIDVLLMVVLVIRPANRYFKNCAFVRALGASDTQTAD